MKSESMRPMATIAAKLLNDNQGLSLIDHAGNIARRAIGKQPIVNDYLFWPKGLLALGLSEYFDYASGAESILADDLADISDNVLSGLQTYFDKWLGKGALVKKIDDAVAGKALIRLYRITGDERYLRGIEAIYSFLTCLPSDIGGAIEYQSTGCVFADGAGQSAMFLSEYSRLTGDIRAYELGLRQIRRYLDMALDSKTMLPYHAYRCSDSTSQCEKLGIVGWGRAVGWLLMGASQYPELSNLVTPLFEFAIECQRDDGLIPWCLLASEGPADTSATAMIMYAAIESGCANGLFLSKAEHGLMESVDERGRVQRSQAECVGIGLYPQQYGHFSFGQGVTLAALSRGQSVG